MATVNKVIKNGKEQWVVRYQNPNAKGKRAQVSKYFPKGQKKQQTNSGKGLRMKSIGAFTP